MKSGNVILVGRPNSGKSTLINALIDKKISITSPKPQTTRKVICGYWWNDDTQIVFWDTPGIFTKVKDLAAKKINPLPGQSMESADVILYLIDKTRSRGDEENKILGLVRQSKKPKILVINKIDLLKPDYIYEYKFLEDEFDDWMEISALKKINLKPLLKKVIEYLPKGEPLFDIQQAISFPGNLTPKEFIAEIIREKIFTILRQELPYTTAVIAESIEEKKDIFHIKAKILTTDKRYKRMIIGTKGATIKEIGTLARKELELITSKKVYLGLEVVTDPHWPEYLL